MRAGQRVPPLASRGAQAARTAAFAAVATVVALGAHVCGGGSLPSTGPVLLVLVLNGTAGAWSAVRQPSLPRTVAVLGGMQAAAHLVLADPVAADSAHPFGTHTGGAHPALHGAAGGAPGMLLAHTLAVVATAAVLTRGERAAAGVLAWLRVAVPAARPIAVPVARRRPVHTSPDQPRTGLVCAARLRRRGPPALLALT